MDLAQFTAEAERLARSATLLKTKGKGEPTAYWHGINPGALCISLQHKRRWLNVYLDSGAGYVKAESKPIISSTPLFGEEVRSLPPVDAVFLLGSNGVESYLRSLGWKRSEPFNSNFPDKVPGQYEMLWQENCPIYTNKSIAVAGGWHFPWPDGDFQDLKNSELVVWTLEGSEPWIEVFAEGDRFVVKQRVT